MKQDNPLPSLGYRPIISAQQGNYGVTLSIGGMFLRPLVIVGGLIAVERLFECLTL
jgi:hypothetical protein